MPLSTLRCFLCAVSLSCLAWFGACSINDAHGSPPELFIFNELCALKDEPGPCKAIKDRFFFSVDTGRCQLFEYGGCGGNANNFETLAECQETCLVSDRKSPCHLTVTPGPCRGLVSRYFFDSTSQQCRHFYYGGCFGNANNFRTMAQCQARCQNPAKPTAAPAVHSATRASVVQSAVITGELPAREPLVQQNVTNPESKGFSPPEICFRPVERGTCEGEERRFAYNPEKKRCQAFIYSGCGGNENNFKYRKHCAHKCNKSRADHEKMSMIRVKKRKVNSLVHRSV